MYKEGQKSKAICPHCDGVKNTTFLIKNYSINGTVIKDILVGVCDSCEEIITIPAISTEKIKDNLKLEK